MMIRAAIVGLVAAAVAGGAVAAERRTPTPAMVPSAPACLRHGPGFVEVPGTRTCIRIGGRVRAEAGGGTGRVSRDDIAAPRASGRVSVDTRTDTDYGPVRTFVRMRAGQPGTGP